MNAIAQAERVLAGVRTRVRGSTTLAFVACTCWVADAVGAPLSSWAGRVDSLRILAERQPRRASAQRALGTALVAKQDYAAAQQVLERACALEPNEPDNHFWLGRALEGRDRFEEALASYDRQMRLARTPRARLEVMRHSRRLFLRTVRHVLRARLAALASAQLDETRGWKAMVPNFATLGESPGLRGFARGLAAWTTTDLNSAGVETVEIAKLDTLLDEIERSGGGYGPRWSSRGQQGGSVSPNRTLVALAPVLQARTLVQGGVGALFEAPSVELTGIVVDCIEAGESSLGRSAIRGRTSEASRLMDEFVRRILPLVRAERAQHNRRRRSPPAIHSRQALEALGRGMMALDDARRGGIDDAQRAQAEAIARTEFRAALRIDPHMEPARTELQLLELDSRGIEDYEASLLAQMERPTGREEHLLRSGALLGLGPGPWRRDAEADDRGGRPRAKSGSATIMIGGVLP